MACAGCIKEVAFVCRATGMLERGRRLMLQSGNKIGLL